MINSLTNQNYEYGYAATAVNLPVNNSVPLQAKIEVAQKPVNIKESKNLQELIPRQCQT